MTRSLQNSRPSLRDLLNKRPPFLCRLLASKNHGWAFASHRDLAKASGLSVWTVRNLSLRKNWNGLNIDVIEAFASACGVNLLCAGERFYEARRRGSVRFKTANPNQRAYYARLMQIT